MFKFLSWWASLSRLTPPHHTIKSTLSKETHLRESWACVCAVKKFEGFFLIIAKVSAVAWIHSTPLAQFLPSTLSFYIFSLLARSHSPLLLLFCLYSREDEREENFLFLETFSPPFANCLRPLRQRRRRWLCVVEYRGKKEGKKMRKCLFIHTENKIYFFFIKSKKTRPERVKPSTR